MARTISQIHFVEPTDFDFQLNFLYKGKNLQTVSIPRSYTVQQITTIINTLLDDFDLRSSDTNYQSLKLTFEGKSVDI